MENPRISETTREKLEEAAVSVFMEQYAKALDAGIDKKMEECAGDEFPPELDKRCRALIEQEYAKERNKRCRKSALRVLRSAAVVAVALLSLCSVLFVTVEAFRIPVMNFFAEHTSRYWQLSGKPDEDAILETFNPENPLDGIIPDEFVLTDLNGTWEGESMSAEYSNGNNSAIIFTISPSLNNAQLDTEDSLATPYKVMGYDALKLEEDGFTRITWLDEKNARILTLCATNISMEMVEHYAETVASLIG